MEAMLLARTVNTAVRAVRREAFVDVAQALIQTKGYEQMSVQDVLDGLDASRGAFYHYFDSKAALLEAVVERMAETAMAELAPMVADPELPAMVKIERLFSGIAGFKAERQDFVFALIEVWLSDDNAIVREKLRQHSMVHLTPLLAAIVRQGKAEGSFSATSPDETARVLVSILQGASEMATELFIARRANRIAFEAVGPALASYSEAFDRVLGVPDGSLTIVDPAVLRLWFGGSEMTSKRSCCR
jgi:AcrR family transcriptional regulator